MMVALRLASLVAAVSLTSFSCSPPAPVIQGKVVEFDARAGRLVVQDESQRDARPLEMDITAADVGELPLVGDRVRVVYRQTNTASRAIAVMNLTRQLEPASSGRH